MPNASSAPLVSVIVPVYNSQDYISECVESVLGQSFDDFELILVDDGSTDDSLSLIQNKHADNPKLNVLHKQNGGLSSARNLGMNAACGKYILFLDSDDYLQPNALKLLTAKAETENLDQLFYEGEALFESEECRQNNPNYIDYYTYKAAPSEVLSGQELFSQLLPAKQFKPSACLQLLKRKFLEENNITFYEGILHEDNPFTLECLMLSDRSAVLKEPLYVRRVHDGSITTSNMTFKHVYGFYRGARLTEEALKENWDSLSPKARQNFEQQIRTLMASAAVRCADIFEDAETAMEDMPLEERMDFNSSVMALAQEQKKLKEKNAKLKAKLQAAREKAKASKGASKHSKSNKLSGISRKLRRLSEKSSKEGVE